MCFGGKKSTSAADLKESQDRKARSMDNDDSFHKDMMKEAAEKRASGGVTRPKARTGNAYLHSTGKRLNPSLLQRVLDTSPTYKAVSYLGRRFDSRG